MLKSKPTLWLPLFLAACLTMPVALYAEDFDEEEEEFIEEVEKIISNKMAYRFLEQHFPHHLEELNELKSEEPDDFRESLLEVKVRIFEYMEMRKEDPELAEQFLHIEKLHEQTWQLAGQLHDADEGEHEAIEKKIRKHMGKAFDMETEIQQRELEELEEEVRMIRDEIEDRIEHREEILEEELEEILEDLEEDEEEEDEEEDEGEEEDEDEEDEDF